MQSVHKFLFNQEGSSTRKLTLPPLVVDTEPVIKSMSWLLWRSNTPPAFLEPQPLTTMDKQRNVIQLPRSHRLSLSSLSSISTESSSEDDHSWAPPVDVKNGNGYVGAEQQGDQNVSGNSNSILLPSFNTTLDDINSRNDTSITTMTKSPRQNYLSQIMKPSDSVPAAINCYVTHVDVSGDPHRRHLHNNGSLSPSPPASSSVDGNDRPTPVLQHSTSSPSSSSGSDSSSPSSPVPSSVSTFWASPNTIQSEQRHDFVTKNAHIKRPRNAWIHFRCYFGQALKAKDPTIRAEEISKRASEYWSRLTNKQKKPWHVIAEQEKLAHQEAFPDYRYRPKRALPKSLVLTYPSTTLAGDLNSCRKKFRLA